MDDAAFSLVMAMTQGYYLPKELIIPGAGLYKFQKLMVSRLPSQRFACSELRRVHVPKEIVSLGDGCFRKCKSLEFVTFEKDIQVQVFTNSLFF